MNHLFRIKNYDCGYMFLKYLQEFLELDTDIRVTHPGFSYFLSGSDIYPEKNFRSLQKFLHLNKCTYIQILIT